MAHRYPSRQAARLAGQAVYRGGRFSTAQVDSYVPRVDHELVFVLLEHLEIRAQRDTEHGRWLPTAMPGVTRALLARRLTGFLLEFLREQRCLPDLMCITAREDHDPEGG